MWNASTKIFPFQVLYTYTELDLYSQLHPFFAAKCIWTFKDHKLRLPETNLKDSQFVSKMNWEPGWSSGHMLGTPADLGGIQILQNDATAMDYFS